MNQGENKYGLRVFWKNGRTSEYWFATTEIRAFVSSAFTRMRHDGWDGDASPAQVADVFAISRDIIARAALHRRQDCTICGTPNADHHYGQCYICRFWADQFATPGGHIINGNHYRIGEEPTSDQLRRFPKQFGCNGTGFVIRVLPDGPEIVTHNLWHQGEIPPGLTRPDTAVFVRDPEPAKAKGTLG